MYKREDSCFGSKGFMVKTIKSNMAATATPAMIFAFLPLKNDLRFFTVSLALSGSSMICSEITSVFSISSAFIDAPHFSQKSNPLLDFSPQLGQKTVSNILLPQLGQNFDPSSSLLLQLSHVTIFLPP